MLVHWFVARKYMQLLLSNLTILNISVHFSTARSHSSFPGVRGGGGGGEKRSQKLLSRSCRAEPRRGPGKRLALKVSYLATSSPS